jgi:hypothetical protein
MQSPPVTPTTWGAEASRALGGTPAEARFGITVGFVAGLIIDGNTQTAQRCLDAPDLGARILDLKADVGRRVVAQPVLWRSR